MSEERMIGAMKRLSETLTPGDLDHTLEQITAAAVEVLPGVYYASITVMHGDGRLDTHAPTDQMLLGLDAAQYQLREGPCYRAAVDETFVASDHLAADERFPRYGAFAAQAGIRAQAGVRLFQTPNPQANGALNLYSRDVGSFRDMNVIGPLFAHQAAVALDYAREIENLREAIQTRQRIGRAVGIVMERYQLPEERAFAFLARVSQTRNVKLRDVASELILEAEQRSSS
jgi:ANTAR domain